MSSKPLLHDFAANVYSQLGEDGMIAALFDVIGIEHHRCAEFGAWDGLFCSNTAHLWRDQGWQSIQIEPHPPRFKELKQNTARKPVLALNEVVLPANVNELCGRIGALDLLSIDVDGDDYELFAALTLTPRVVVIEFNQSVPPHMDIRQVGIGKGHCFSSSAFALKKLADSKGYRLVGRSESNLFFVHESVQTDLSEHFNTEYMDMFDWSEYTYLITDMVGRMAFIGRGPFWGYGDSLLDYPLRSAGPNPPWKKYLEFE